MICKHCGAQAAEGAHFCEYCGEGLELEAESTLTEQNGSAAGQGATDRESGEGGGFTSVNPAADAYLEDQSAPTSEMPMKWHKFLVYFALWMGALSNLSDGCSIFNGGHYGDARNEVYLQVSALKQLDMICGIIMIAAAVLGFYTAYRLLTMKKGAPKLLPVVYGISAALNLGYSVAAALIIKNAMRMIDVSSVLTSGITMAIFSAIMLIVTMIYYKKREHLFIN